MFDTVNVCAQAQGFILRLCSLLCNRLRVCFSGSAPASVSVCRAAGRLQGCPVTHSYCVPHLSCLTVVDSLQLGINSMSHLSGLFSVKKTITGCCFDAAGYLKLRSGWPQLDRLRLSNNHIDSKAIAAITHNNTQISTPCVLTSMC